MFDPDLNSLYNVRSCWRPDPGYVFVEVDLERADAQVCAWDAGATELKGIFQRGDDIHSDNARWIYGDVRPRAPHINGMTFRDNAKRAVHATDYYGQAPTISEAIAAPKDRVEAFIRYWTQERFPEIGAWHKRVKWELTTKSAPTIRNAFGFRRCYVGGPPNRTEHLLGQALAWICQTTVSNVINESMLAMDCGHEMFHEAPCGKCLCCTGWPVQLIMQDHDSLLMQVERRLCPDIFPRIIACTHVTVPYPDPLIIPASLKWSETSWGEMQPWSQ